MTLVTIQRFFFTEKLVFTQKYAVHIIMQHDLLEKIVEKQQYLTKLLMDIFAKSCTF